MTPYILGHLLGRLVVSYVVVLIAMICIKRGDWRSGLRRSIGWYAVAATLVIFVFGLSVSVAGQSTQTMISMLQ